MLQRKCAKCSVSCFDCAMDRMIYGHKSVAPEQPSGLPGTCALRGALTFRAFVVPKRVGTKCASLGQVACELHRVRVYAIPVPMLVGMFDALNAIVVPILVGMVVACDVHAMFVPTKHMFFSPPPDPKPGVGVARLGRGQKFLGCHMRQFGRIDTPYPYIHIGTHWEKAGGAHFRWKARTGHPPPTRMVCVTETVFEKVQSHVWDEGLVGPSRVPILGCSPQGLSK